MDVAVLEVVLEHIEVLVVLLPDIVIFHDLPLHPLLTKLQVGDDQREVVVHDLEMNDLAVHHCQLVLHLRDFLLTWALVPLQLLDLVVQHISELLKLLFLLAEFVDSLRFFLDGLLPLHDILATGLLLNTELVQHQGLGMDVLTDFEDLLVLLLGVLLLLGEDCGFCVFGHLEG